MYLIQSRLAAIVHVDGSWILATPGTGGCCQVEEFGNVLPELVTFCRMPRLASEVVAWLQWRGLDEDAVASILATLQMCGFLVPYQIEDANVPSTGSGLDFGSGDAFYNVWSYVSHRRLTRFADYSEKGTLDEDAIRMSTLQSIDPAPSIYKHYPQSARIPLPHPATTAFTEGALAKLGHLLFWSFGRLREVSFHGVLPAQLKAVPSNGARHPFEAYMCVGDAAACLNQGLYHYDVADHALRMIGSSPWTIPGELVIVITAIFDRVQWRYRHGWHYQSIFFDLGHLQANLKFVAQEYDLALMPCAPSVSAGDWVSLTEEPVAAFVVAGL